MLEELRLGVTTSGPESVDSTAPLHSADADARLSTDVDYMRCVSVLTRCLYQQVERQRGVDATPWRENCDRLDDSLQSFGSISSQPRRAALRAIELSDALRDAVDRSPECLLGAVYVFDESGSLMTSPLMERLAIPKVVTTESNQRIAQLENALDADTWSSTTRRHVLDFAKRLASGMRTLQHELTPERELLGAVNHRAGGHPATWDPREVRAVFDAGLKSWKATPYYQARYGQKGRAFTQSDSLWLACIAGFPSPDAQIDWLAQVLSSRGMPSLLLEEHLMLAAEHLAVWAPERAEHHAALTHQAQRLRTLRLAAMPADEAERVVQRVAEHGDPLRLGPLVAGAIADGRRGIHRAVSSLQTWLNTQSDAASAEASAILTRAE